LSQSSRPLHGGAGRVPLSEPAGLIGRVAVGVMPTEGQDVASTIKDVPHAVGEDDRVNQEIAPERTEPRVVREGVGHPEPSVR
jgi:hypothetical protein